MASQDALIVEQILGGFCSKGAGFLMIFGAVRVFMLGRHARKERGRACFARQGAEGNQVPDGDRDLQ